MEQFFGYPEDISFALLSTHLKLFLTDTNMMNNNDLSAYCVPHSAL